MSTFSELEKSTLEGSQKSDQSIAWWIRHFSDNWNNKSAMYWEILVDGDSPDLPAALEDKLARGDIEDFLTLLEPMLNQRVLSLEVNEDVWETVFFGFYSLVQDYVLSAFLFRRDFLNNKEKVHPRRALRKEVRDFAVWVHVYFN